jgi:DNA-binding NarL/FixJ family response regulator
MQNEELIIVFDKMTSSKVRILRIFEDHGIGAEDANNKIELMNVLSINQDKKCILIMGIDDELSDDGLELVKVVKQLYSELAILILTSITKREFFARCIAEGVADYLLKPFEDDVLFERAQKLMNINHRVAESILRFNFPGYLRCEIIKAKKGKYPFTLLKSTVFSLTKDGFTGVDYEFSRLSNNIYEDLNSLFWETDIFIQYNGDSYLGFFPFCGEENSALINEKVKKKFEKMKELNANLRKYEIINSFVTFPEDGDDVTVLLDKLTAKIEETVRL